jgi:hypothetical protein
VDVIFGLFQANKASRVVFLSHEFHLMTQDNLSIDDYRKKMKTTFDALRDISHTVVDLQLILNLVRGLNPCFSSTTDNVADSNPLPDFATAHKKLTLKELHLANEGQVTSQTAFFEGTPSCGSGCHASMFSLGASGSGGG